MKLPPKAACKAWAIIESTGAEHARRSGLVVRRLVADPSLTLDVVWSRARGLSDTATALVEVLRPLVKKQLAA
jgi:hypothetical protein